MTVHLRNVSFKTHGYTNILFFQDSNGEFVVSFIQEHGPEKTNREAIVNIPVKQLKSIETH